MKRNVKGFIILGLLVVISAYLLWLKSDNVAISSENPGSNDAIPQNDNEERSVSTEPPALMTDILRNTPAERERQREAAEDKSLNEWRTPIDFFGKTVNENGQPVPGVSVKIGITDLSSDGHSTYQATSDDEGLFSLTGVTGKHLSISDVEKPGYYVSRNNPRSFFYAGQNENYVASKWNPVVFRLHERGDYGELAGVAGSAVIPKDGTPVGVSITGAKLTSTDEAEIVVRCWTNDQGIRRGDKFDWRCVISAPGGGIQETDEEFPFEAPVAGYQAEVEIDMPVDMSGEWRDKAARKYFVKLASGNYVRLDFEMIPYGEHFFMIGAFVNLSGLRNLEPAPDTPRERLRR